MATSIVLVDDHKLVRDAIRTLLETRDDFAVSAEADDGASALTLVQDLKPDVVVTEVALPRLSGIDLIRRLKRAGCMSQFLILSSHAGSSILQQALAAGAAGFVCKSDTAKELVQAIDAVAAGQRYVSPSIAHHLVDLVAAGPTPPGTDARHLTSREREVLQLVAEGLSSKEIAASLGVSTRTVESHRANVMEKLGIHKVSALVRYAIREGLLNP